MKFLLSLSLIFVSFFTYGKEVIVPAGTYVPLQLSENINSKLSRTGETVYARVIEDVIVGDQVVIREGALAVGKVKTLRESGAVGKGGQLSFVIHSVEAVDGQAIRMVRDTLNSEGRTRGGAVVAHTLLWGPLGLLAKGRQANVLLGTEYEVETRSDTTISIPTNPKETDPYQEWENTFESSIKIKKLKVNLAKGKSKPSLMVVVKDPELGTKIEIVRINDFELPNKIVSTLENKRGQINFPWWGIIRFCKPHLNEIFLRAIFPDGSIGYSSFKFDSQWKLK